MSQPTYRDRQREQILTIAVGLLEAEGLDALQARRVAAEAGCSVGTVYNVFGDIDGLIQAVNALTLAALGDALVAATEGQRPPHMRDHLMALAQGYARYAVNNQQRWQAVFQHRRPEASPPADSYLADQARLLSLIEKAIEGKVPPPDRAKASRALFGAVHGIVALALDNRIGGIVRQELEDEITFIVETTARGLEG